jgi:hypothetical protein
MVFKHSGGVVNIERKSQFFHVVCKFSAIGNGRNRRLAYRLLSKIFFANHASTDLNQYFPAG